MAKRKAETPRLSWAQVCARRIDRHGLAAPWPDTQPAEAVGAICAAHAQVLSAAVLSVALRLAGATRQTVREALWTEHSLIKSYGPRGTVHLLAARDLPMWTGALSALSPAGDDYPETLRFTSDEMEAVLEAIAGALKEAELTGDELGEAIVAATGPWAGELSMPAFQEMWPRWRMAINSAAHRGLLCFGPNRGRKVTYTNPRRWLPGFRPAKARTALAELVRRYLHAFGPATPQHFAQWLSAPRPWAVELFDSLGDELEQVEVAGNVAWALAGDTAAPPEPPPSVRLLPYFDAYVVGCHPRELVYPGRAAERALSRGQAGNFPVLMINGAVAGVWQMRRSGRKIDITVEPFGKLTARQRRELSDQVERIGEILDGPAAVG